MSVCDVEIRLKAIGTWHKDGEVLMPDPGFRYVFVEELQCPELYQKVMQQAQKIDIINLIGGWTEGWGYGGEVAHEERQPFLTLLVSEDYPVFRNLPI